MAGRGARAVRAGVADGQEDGLPAAGGVAPVVRLQDERALGAVGDHEAVDHVVELAAVAAALVDVAHQLPCLTAVRGILEERGGTEEYVSTLLLLLLFFLFLPDLGLVSLRAPALSSCNNTRLVLFSLFPPCARPPAPLLLHLPVILQLLAPFPIWLFSLFTSCTPFSFFFYLATPELPPSRRGNLLKVFASRKGVGKMIRLNSASTRWRSYAVPRCGCSVDATEQRRLQNARGAAWSPWQRARVASIGKLRKTPSV